jgi:hypothetical protein
MLVCRAAAADVRCPGRGGQQPDGVGQRPLAGEDLVDPVFDGSLGDQVVDLDEAVLAEPVGAVGGPVLDGGVPRSVEVDDVPGRVRVESGPGSADGQDERVAAARLDPVDDVLPAGEGDATVEELGVHPAGGEVGADQVPHGHVPGEGQRGLLGRWPGRPATRR